MTKGKKGSWILKMAALLDLILKLVPLLLQEFGVEFLKSTENVIV